MSGHEGREELLRQMRAQLERPSGTLTFSIRIAPGLTPGHEQIAQVGGDHRLLLTRRTDKQFRATLTTPAGESSSDAELTTLDPEGWVRFVVVWPPLQLRALAGRG